MTAARENSTLEKAIPQSLPLRDRPRRWPAVLVALGVTVLLGFTIRDFGLTTDESTYIRNHRRVIDWIGDFADVGFAENLRQPRLRAGWRNACEENKNLPLSTIVSTLGYAVAGHFDSFPAAYRWGNVFVFAAACGVIFHWVRIRYSNSAAFIALAGLLGNPRLFAHANLLAVDTLVGCCWVFACWALVNSRRSWRWSIAFAVIAGLGATTKPTFWFVVPMWIFWGLLHRPRTLGRPAVCLAVVAPLTMLLFSPMWWTDPVGGFLDYLQLLGTDSTGWQIGTYYLGELYQMEGREPVPWHAVPLLTAVTTPIWLLAFAFAGAVRAIRRLGDTSDDGMLWLLSALALPLVCMLPNTPNHDGLRLYRAAFFFLPLLAASGFESLKQFLLRRKPSVRTDDVKRGKFMRRLRWDWIAVAALSSLAIWQTGRMHPGQLSFYNWSVGGLQGAAEVRKLPASLPERRRPSFEIAYWWAGMNERAFAEMQSHIPRGATLAVFPHHDGLDLLREQGQFRSDIEVVFPPDRPMFVLLYGRLGSLADPRAAPFATLFLHGRPVWEKRIDGVRVAALFRLR